MATAVSESPHLDGRVFARLRQFPTLLPSVQEDVAACREFLTAQRDEVFEKHHPHLVKGVLGVKGKQLIEIIDKWVTERQAAEMTTMTEAQTQAAVTSEAKTTDEGAKATVAMGEATAPAPAPVPAADPRAYAKQVIDGLVLCGFLTPFKEHEKMAQVTNAPRDYYRDNELFVPVPPPVTDLTTTSVWAVADGAIFAGRMKRKAGLLAPLTQGKDAYAVVNEPMKKLFIFDSDVSRATVAEFDGPLGTHVSFDSTHFVHGVRIWNEQASELLNTSTKIEQEALVSALIDIGAQYREDANFDLDKISSFFELKDADLSGAEVAMDCYRGKVVLVVNVSSHCKLTPRNYPELVLLDSKYRDRGLVILAFPCNQFGAQEPGSPEEIRSFVAQYGVMFPIFEKRDVNGNHARPVFRYLKSKLPGSFGNYVKWNFTKFLIDRQGQPKKRYAPVDAPLSFENDIVMLLKEQVEPELETTGHIDDKPIDVQDPNKATTTATTEMNKMALNDNEASHSQDVPMTSSKVETGEPMPGEAGMMKP